MTAEYKFSKEHQWKLEHYEVNRLPVNFYPQVNKYSCGAASVQMIYDFFGLKISQKDIWNQIKSRRPGTNGFYATTYALARNAKKHGFETFTGKIKLRPYIIGHENDQVIDKFFDRTINKLKLPIIVCWRQPDYWISHFSVVSAYNGYGLEILDPLTGPKYTYDKDFLSVYWQEHQFRPWEEGRNKNQGIGGGGIFLAIYPKEKIQSFPLSRGEGKRVLKNF